MKVDHITLLVSSLSDSMDYYDNLLPLVGFTKKRDWVWSDGEGMFFQFMEARPNSRAYERYGAGLNHLGFSASSPEQVQAIRVAMQNAGFKVPEIQNLGGTAALFMADPDGIRFEITYYPPGVAVVD